MPCVEQFHMCFLVEFTLCRIHLLFSFYPLGRNAEANSLAKKWALNLFLLVAAVIATVINCNACLVSHHFYLLKKKPNINLFSIEFMVWDILLIKKEIKYKLILHWVYGLRWEMKWWFWHGNWLGDVIKGLRALGRC